jgi:hypothetical protein
MRLYSVFRHFERNFDVALGTKVVDLCRLDLGDNVDKIGAVAEVSVVQMELVRA